MKIETRICKIVRLESDDLNEMEKTIEKYEADGYERLGDFSMQQGRTYVQEMSVAFYRPAIETPPGELEPDQ
jgi:hypothetical protein